MESELKNLLTFAYQDYLVFESSQQQSLLSLNSLTITTYRPEVRVSEVRRAREVMVITRNPLAERPKGNQYLPSNMNIKPEEHEDLRFLPFDEVSGHVCKPKSIDGNYLRTPFNEYKHSAEIIENKQLADFLMLHLLLTSPEFSIRIVAKLLEKTASVIQDLKQDVKRHYLTPLAFIGTDVKGLEGKFCRICKTISCFLHYPSTTKSILTDTFYDHTEKRNDHYWSVVDHLDLNGWKNKWYRRSLAVTVSGGWMAAHSCPGQDNCARYCVPSEIYVPSASEKWIAKVLLRKGVTNPCVIAEFSGMTCEQVGSVLQTLTERILDPAPIELSETTFPAGDEVQYSMEAHHISEPSTCSCAECSPDACLCFEGKGNDEPRNCCEKFCECPLKCGRRFLGCNCKFGGCVTRNCVCFANNRECDPDLCLSCCASTHLIHSSALDSLTTSKRGSWVLCRNTVIQNFKRKKTAIALSTIPGAGFGLFALEPIRAHEYITEYTGELITDTEAERRGTLYDSREISYIFSLTSEQSIDATTLGNKLRYANHRAEGEENCYARNMRVMGNTKVILLAKRDIQCGEELFFDYGYKESVSYGWLVKYRQELEEKKKRSKRKA